MGILDSYKDLINASFSKWIKVEDKQSKWTIEEFPYNTGVDEDATKPHCWECVTVNKSWFKTMKYFDKVKLIVDRERYKKDNIFKGEIGTIWLPEIRDNEFYVAFETGNDKDWYKYACIKIEDLELVEDGGRSDEYILSDIPQNNPKWWCKVEDGYIINLLGEKKNKEPYKYNS